MNKMDNTTFGSYLNDTTTFSNSDNASTTSEAFTWPPTTLNVTSLVTELVKKAAYNVTTYNKTVAPSHGTPKPELSVDVFQLNLTWSELEALLQGQSPYASNENVAKTPSPSADLHALAYVVAIVLFYTTVLMVVVGMHLRNRRNSFDEEHYAALLNKDEMAQREKYFIRKLNILKMRALKDAPLIDQIPVHTV